MTARARAGLVLGILVGLSGEPVLAADLSGVSAWVGKEPFTKITAGKTLWDQAGVQEAMREALGSRYFSLARKTMLSGPQSPVATDGKGVFVAWSCKAHDCGDNQISLFLDSAGGTAQACMRLADRSGRVQDLWLAEGKARVLGNDACLSSGDDPFSLLARYGARR